MKIGILGSGTWGTALANALVNGHEICVWSRFEEEANKLNETRRHPNLPGAYLDKRILFTSDIELTISNADIVMFAVPSIYVRETAVIAKQYLNTNQIIVDVAKGIEEKTLYTLSEVIKDVVGHQYRVVALSGPTHAEEVSIGLPSLIVAASDDVEAAKLVQKEFSLSYFRVYLNKDIKGVELSGALKNIIALAGGISDGMGYGDNAKAAIITRGLAEITRLGRKLGCSDASFFGLTGVGDIVVTATSTHSRNYNAGFMIGQGNDLKTTLAKIGMVVEGVNCLKAAKQLSIRENIELPIVNAVYAIVFENKKPLDAVNALFARDLATEQ